jgi:hypothetical protein
LGDGWRRGGGGGAVGVGPVWSVKGGVGGSGEGGPGVRARAPPVRGINVGGKGRSLAGAVALKIDSFPSKWRNGAASFDQAGGGVEDGHTPMTWGGPGCRTRPHRGGRDTRGRCILPRGVGRVRRVEGAGGRCGPRTTEFGCPQQTKGARPQWSRGFQGSAGIRSAQESVGGPFGPKGRGEGPRVADRRATQKEEND